MSLLTELFVATMAEARSYDHTSSERLSAVRLGGLTNLELETLWSILRNEEWDPGVHALPPIADTDGTWTFEFPAEYTEKLAELTPREIALAAVTWAATEEISATASDVAPIIATLVDLARKVDEGRALFVWTSL